MIGEACRFYGWTPDYVLQMPATRFFEMLKASRILSAVERIESYKTQTISISTHEFSQKLIEEELQKIDLETFGGPPPETPIQNESVNEKTNEAVAQFLIQSFTKMKGLMAHGQ